MNRVTLPLRDASTISWWLRAMKYMWEWRDKAAFRSYIKWGMN